jgi:predicted acetyltransferase
MRVELQPVPLSSASILANLVQLYCHDLSVSFGLEIGADGRFGYAHLALYWSDPERRFPYFITVDGKLAGFALATRGSPANTDPSVLDVAEFFVLRTQRRSGVGARAAHALWDVLPGRWTVRAAATNEAAVQFWRRTVQGYARGGATSEQTLTLNGMVRHVFTLGTTPGCVPDETR